MVREEIPRSLTAFSSSALGHTLSVRKQFQNEHLRLCGLAFGLGGVRPGKKLVSGNVISSYPRKPFLVSQRKGNGLSGRRKGAFLMDQHPRCGAVLQLADKEQTADCRRNVDRPQSPVKA